MILATLPETVGCWGVLGGRGQRSQTGAAGGGRLVGALSLGRLGLGRRHSGSAGSPRG